MQRWLVACTGGWFTPTLFVGEALEMTDDPANVGPPIVVAVVPLVTAAEGP